MRRNPFATQAEKNDGGEEKPGDQAADKGEQNQCNDERIDLRQILQSGDDFQSHKKNILTIVVDLASPDPLVDSESQLPWEPVGHFSF